MTKRKVPTLSDDERLILKDAGGVVSIGAFWKRRDDGVFETTFESTETGSDWSLDGVIEIRSGELVLSRLSITPARGAPKARKRKGSTPGNGVTSTLLRELGPQVQRFLAVARGLVIWSAFRGSVSDAEWATDIQRAADEPTATGGLPDKHYEHVARRYLELQSLGLRNGLMQRLTEFLADDFGRPCPIGTVREWVRRAERRGFLEPAQHGKAGRVPGPKLKKES